MSLLSFPISEGFINGISLYWFLERNIYHFDSTELTLTLKEWARIFVMDIIGSLPLGINFDDIK